jgi:hypothetical protein
MVTVTFLAGKEKQSERHTTQRRPDHCGPEAGRGGIDDGGALPPARDYRSTIAGKRSTAGWAAVKPSG